MILITISSMDLLMCFYASFNELLLIFSYWSPKKIKYIYLDYCYNNSLSSELKLSVWSLILEYLCNFYVVPSFFLGQFLSKTYILGNVLLMHEWHYFAKLPILPETLDFELIKYSSGLSELNLIKMFAFKNLGR